MSTVSLGLIISLSVTLFLVFLFRYERRVGRRVGERTRARVDFYVLKTTYTLHKTLRRMGKDMALQILHYLFHSFLRLVLYVVHKFDAGLRAMMQVNRTLAKRAERESVTRSKLEEIALHKAETALTEEEKRAHKEKILSGF